jgi:serine/threonine-protein kinase
MRLQEGNTLDSRYRLQRRLGSGGMADVWLAEDTELSRPVAVKVLHDRFAQDAQFVERFRREAAAAAGLMHPNVVGVFDRGQVDGTYYIAMEYVEGSSLKDLIDRGLNVAQAVEITRQILAAEQFAHEHGIVHRDIKPQNVIVDPEGRIRVLDFGIARAGASEITQTGSVMGTAQYLSPEQAQGLDVAPSSDIYSTGVVLYEMLTGRVPFDGDSAVAVALKQVSEQPAPPSTLNPAVPPAIDAVVLRALSKDPANRFTTAAEFSQALDVAEADPHNVRDTALFAAVVDPEAEAAAAAEERRKRRRRWIMIGLLAAVLAGLLAILLINRLGPELVKVPGVTGQDVEKAADDLEAAGFEVDVDEFPNQAKSGTVLEQDPTEGEEAEEGSTVTISVSSGPGQGTVPDVIDQPEQEAVDEIQDAGFEVKSKRRTSSDIDEGNVIRTTPSPGLRARQGSTVTIFVSNGPKLTTVPDVIGLSEDAAVATIRDAGLVADTEFEESDQPEGTVISEDPGPGSRIPEGDPVSIGISEGPGDVNVPNVVGQSQESAVSRLSALGLNVRVVEVETDSESEDGQVLDQTPSGGSSVPPDTDVTIDVGVFVEPEEEDPAATDEQEVTP